MDAFGVSCGLVKSSTAGAGNVSLIAQVSGAFPVVVIGTALNSGRGAI
jgi:hypothetical protein